MCREDRDRRGWVQLNYETFMRVGSLATRPSYAVVNMTLPRQIVLSAP